MHSKERGSYLLCGNSIADPRINTAADTMTTPSSHDTTDAIHAVAHQKLSDRTKHRDHRKCVSVTSRPMPMIADAHPHAEMGKLVDCSASTRRFLHSLRRGSGHVVPITASGQLLTASCTSGGAQTPLMVGSVTVPEPRNDVCSTAATSGRRSMMRAPTQQRLKTSIDATVENVSLDR